MQQWVGALEDVQLDPADAPARNALAWLLAAHSDLTPHDSSRAVALAGEAVKLAPDDSECWLTRGVARNRAGDLDTAIESLDRSSSLDNGYGSEID